MAEIIKVPNIKDYTQEIDDNGCLILTPKTKYSTEDELNRGDFTSSSIIHCKIMNKEEIISNNKTKYRQVLDEIWVKMPAQKILQTTTFNMKLTNENGKSGYIWCPKINMSIQNKDAKGTLKEIIHMVKINGYNIDISIKLKSGKMIYFKL